MDKSMVKGIVVGVAIAVAATGVASYTVLNKPKFAQVVSAKEVTETVKTPREECHQVTVQKQAPVKDENRLVGTIAGAVVGGVLGNQVGGGTGKKVATVAGAAAGGYAGNQIQDSMQKSDTVATTETRCKTVYDSTQKSLGYDVVYMLDGKEGKVRMAFNPGDKIPVRDGQLVLNEPPAQPVADTASTQQAPAK